MTPVLFLLLLFAVGEQARAPTGKWEHMTTKSEMDDPEIAAISLAAENEIFEPRGTRAVRPELVIGCGAGKMFVYITTRLQIHPEPEGFDPENPAREKHPVRLRFGSQKPLRAQWWVGRRRESLAAPDPGAVVVRLVGEDGMVGEKRFLFEFTPFDSGPTVVRFRIDGVTQAVWKIREYCGLAGGDAPEVPSKPAPADPPKAKKRPVQPPLDSRRDGPIIR